MEKKKEYLIELTNKINRTIKHSSSFTYVYETLSLDKFKLNVKYNYDETDFVKDNFGNIICSIERIGVYDDVKKAETDLTELIQLNERLNWKYGSKSKYFCFTLDELYLNNAIYGVDNISTFESRRSYLNDGRLNCFSDYDVTFNKN